MAISHRSRVVGPGDELFTDVFIQEADQILNSITSPTNLLIIFFSDIADFFTHPIT